MQDPDRKAGYLATAAAEPSLLLKGKNPDESMNGKSIRSYGTLCVWQLMKN